MGRAALLALVLVALGCQSAPPVYPSFTNPEHTWFTYKRAWELGDIDVLRAVYGGNLAFQLREEIELNGEAATAAYYRGNFGQARFEDEDFSFEGGELAYLSVTIAGMGVRRRLRYSFVRFGRYWKIVAFVVKD